jgi:hypothetical protein
MELTILEMPRLPFLRFLEKRWFNTQELVDVPDGEGGFNLEFRKK